MTDFFDTVGTAVAVGNQAGLTDEKGELPQTRACCSSTARPRPAAARSASRR
jgi:xanthine/uracil/vitamin C permease (AzgA family)